MLQLSLSKSAIGKAVETLRQGGVVVLPTETCYGLSADITNSKAVSLIFKIKKRPKKKSFSIVCADLQMAKKWFVLGPEELKLAKKYWSGPLAMILKAKLNKICIQSLAKDKTAAVRVSSSKVMRAICRKLGRPVVSTSANISGAENPYSVKDVLAQFSGQKYQPDLILDEGRLPKQPPSTIVKVQGKKVKILRQGTVHLSKISNF